MTIIENAAREPEIDNLIRFLNLLGCKVRRTNNGKTISILGILPNFQVAKQLIKIDIIPDRIDMGTFAIIGATLHGPIKIFKASSDYLAPLLKVLKKIGAEISIEKHRTQQIITVASRRLEPVSLGIRSEVFPGFATDWGPLMHVLMTQIESQGTFYETVHNNRFHHINELRKLGANIEYTSSPGLDLVNNVLLPNTFEENHPHAILIKGNTRLKGGHVVSANDIRSGAALVLAGLLVDGETKICNYEHVERGYQDFITRLSSIGADVKVMP